VDQCGQLATAQHVAATADFVDQQQDQLNKEDRHQDVVVCRKLNQVSNHQGCSTRLKMPASIHSPPSRPKPDGPAAKQLSCPVCGGAGRAPGGIFAAHGVFALKCVSVPSLTNREWD